MMKKIIVLIVIALQLVSCNLNDLNDDFERVREYELGTLISVLNSTDEEFEIKKIYIGGVKEGKFFPTDSLDGGLIPKRISENEFSETRFYDENSSLKTKFWYPSIAKIRAISSVGRFRIKLKDQFLDGELVNLNNMNAFSNFGGITLKIKENKIIFDDLEIPRE